MIQVEPIRILHIEDSGEDSELVERQLRREGLEIALKRVDSEADFVRELREFDPQLVLSDNTLPALDSSAALSLLKAHRPETPFILVSGTIGEERAVELLKSGATDYVLKDRLSRLSSAVERALLELQERSARRSAEEAQRESARQLRQLADAMPQIVWAAGPDGELAYVNQRWFDFTGIAPDRVSLEASAELIHADDRDATLNRYRAAIRSGEPFELECRMVDRLTGLHRWHLCRAVPIRDPLGCITRWFGTATDIDDRKRAEEELLRNAYYDRLTRLPNRALFEDRLAKAIAASSRQRGQVLAVLFMDVDRFKLVNDSLGHSAGDKLLSAVARRMERLIRPCDTLARFGGDEFAVLVERLTSDEQARPVAERILKSLNEPFHIDEYEIAATVSVGIALSTGPSETTESLLRNADSAMYRAKSLGPGRCEMFDSHMHEASLATLNLERDLRWGLDRGEFVLYYQPILSLSTGELTACEALVRWNHPTRGVLAPAAFIGLAEETGLIVPLGAFVLRTACAQMQAWAQAGFAPFDLAVNCSARQFTQSGFASEVARVLQSTALDPRRLKLELTESLLMESSNRVQGTLSELKALGVQLSIDDFGTGYSSLAYLRRLPCTSLKIDRSFVQDVNRDEEADAITSAIISMAHNLRLKVIAEGIEDEAQRQLLCARGCNEGQGYLFSRPVPAAELSAMLR